ncbi:MAG: glycosyltransferase family 4 protein [Anaerolineae bacterium]|nr:glycosyltransferase family 4 protein [Anaerolineae bacterium]
MNILLFSTVANTRYGGVVAWARNLVATLGSMGHQVHVLTWGTVPADAAAWGPHFHFLRLDPRVLALPIVRFWYTYLAAARAATRLLGEHDIQVIQTVSPYDAWAASVARGTGPAGIVLSVHGAFPTEQQQRWKSRWRRRAYLPLENTAFLKCDVVTTSSAWLQRELTSIIGRTRAVVIPNGIIAPLETGEWPTLSSLNLPENKPILLTLNNLFTFHRRQGTKLLIAAAPAILDRFPEAQFLVVGGVNNPTRDQESLRWARQEAGNLPFIFTGYRPEHPYTLLAVADIYVHPSFLDNSPTSVMEAMVMSKPIVATRVGGIPEIISHKQTGLLVPQEPTALAGAVVSLLEDWTWARSLGERARDEALRSFTWIKIGERFVALYKDIWPRSNTVEIEGHREDASECQEESHVR